MKEKIEQRVMAWKKVFTENLDGFNQNSSWKDILLHLKPSATEISNLVENALSLCGGFSSEERTNLYDLPHYADTLAIARKHLWDGYGNIASVPFSEGDMAYFLIYPKENETMAKKNVATVIEAVIVMKHPPQFDIDVFTFLPSILGARSIVVRYDTKIPQEWLEEKQKYDALEKQCSQKKSFDDDVAF